MIYDADAAAYRCLLFIFSPSYFQDDVAFIYRPLRHYAIYIIGRCAISHTACHYFQLRHTATAFAELASGLTPMMSFTPFLYHIEYARKRHTADDATAFLLITEQLY